MTDKELDAIYAALIIIGPQKADAFFVNGKLMKKQDIFDTLFEIYYREREVKDGQN